MAIVPRARLISIVILFTFVVLALNASGYTSSTTTIAATPSSNSVLGQSVTFTATVWSPGATGVVDFYDSGKLIGRSTLDTVSLKASFTTAILAPGSHSISAEYSGDATYAISWSSALSYNVTPRPTVALISPGAAHVLVRTGKSFQVTVGDTLNDASAGRFVVLAGTAPVRKGHTAAKLLDGNVFFAGGLDASSAVTSAAYYFSAATGTFAPVAGLNSPRYMHTATTLRDGRVLIVGGSSTADYSGAMATAEIFDPTTGLITALGSSLGTPRVCHSAVLLNDGRVLILGGSTNTSQSVTGLEVYDPGTGNFTTLSVTLPKGRIGAVATLLKDGKVLILGGDLSAIVFDPATNSFSATGSPLGGSHSYGTATLLPDGAVLIAGGDDALPSVAELYNSATGTFVYANGLRIDYAYSSAAQLNTGKVLIVSGDMILNYPAYSAKLYTPAYDPQGTASLSSYDATDTFADCTLNLSGTGTSTCSASVTPQHYNSGSRGIDGHYLGAADHTPNVSSRSTLSVDQIPLTVTAVSDTKTYDGTATSSLSPTVSAGTVLAGDVATVSQSFDSRHAGSRSLVPGAMIKDGGGASTLDDYAITLNSVAGTINQRPMTVSAVTDTKVYDGTADSSGVPIITAGTTVGDSSSFSQKYDTKIVGTAKVLTPAGIFNDGNGGNDYAATFVSVNTGTISSKAITAAVSANDKAYDGTVAATAGCTLQNIVSGDAVTCAGSSAVFGDKNVGSPKTVTVSGIVLGGLDAGNYTLPVTTASSAAAIRQAPLTISAKNLTKIYGQPMMTTGTEFTTSGLFSGDSVDNVTLNSAGFTVTAAFVAPGPTYSIMPSAAMGTGLGNYDTSYVTGTLFINKAPLSVAATDASRKYGATNPTLAGTIVGIMNSDGITATYATLATPASAVGAYAITPTLVDPTGKLGNYSVTSTDGTLTVDKATLTASANDKAMTYGGAVPSLTASYTGFFNGDTAAVVTGTPVLATTATLSSSVGVYPITIAQGSLSSTNYNFTFTDGQLTVDKASLSVAATDASRSYGVTNPTFTGTVNGVVSGDGITASYSSSAAAGSPIGTYPIIPTLVDPNSKLGNYVVTSTTNGTLTVNKAALSVIASNKSRTYGAGNPAFDGTVTGAFPADNLTATYASAAITTSSVGTYTITPSLHDPDGKSGNYTVTLTNGMLAVDPAPLNVVTNNKSRSYNTANPSFDGVVTGMQNGDAITASYATNANQASNAGSYPITATLVDPGFMLGNYSVTNQGGTLTITPASTSATVASSKLAINLPASLTLTATVTSTAGTPTGTVTFFEGTTSLGTAILDGTGKATLAVSSPPPNGKTTVSARFEGSQNYATSTSSTTTQYVFPGAPDYTLTATPSNLTVKRGGQGVSTTITFTPVNGFNGNIAFDCNGATASVTCQFTPIQHSGNLDGTPVTGTLTVTAVRLTTRLQSAGHLTLATLFSMSGFGLVGILFVGGSLRVSKRSKRALMTIIGAMVLMLLLASCGVPANQLVTIPVNATATAGTTGAAPNHTLQLQITVVP